MRSLLLFACLLMAGCVVGSYDPATGKAFYGRVGSQEVSGFEAVAPDGTTIKFESQKSDASQIVDAAVGAAVRELKP